MSVFLMSQHYLYACVFVDHYFGFKYVYLLNSQTGDEAVEAKEDFEAYVESHGVYIKRYHADSEIFISARWMNHFKYMHQSLTFSGVNIFHQNGRAEWRIISLQDLARCKIIRSHHRRPSAITANL